MTDYTAIQIVLKGKHHSSKTVISDRATFNAYKSHKITLTQCLEEFRENNEVDPEYWIPTGLFKSWLASLGYGR